MDGDARRILDRKAAQRRARYAAAKPLRPGVMPCGSAPGYFWMPTVQIEVAPPTQRALPTPTRACAPCTVVASAKHAWTPRRQSIPPTPPTRRERRCSCTRGVTIGTRSTTTSTHSPTTPVTTLVTAAPEVTQTTLLLQFPADEQELVIELCGVRARACLSLTCHALHALPLLRRLIKRAADRGTWQPKMQPYTP